jgi:hypothetical protein
MDGETYKYIRRSIVMDKIIWETVMNNALARAEMEDKFILLDFYNPG